ncbi:DNA cytosine methyltransferase [Agrobacterium rosae]|uniref:DNA cytosine methyltransferase n=1 Tax=Agrobacterium rosae TaxID=1972867 RepID=UPI000CD808DC|nr:DNA cytosine methyltransferase [Agrobacterium rosae]POO53909.1 DNA (cytosine-5-)-methyltransferase [Agrobacterium rosae]
MSSNRVIEAVDVFAGAGGFSLAAQQAGMKVVVAVELDKWAAETYRKNFCKANDADQPFLYEADITVLSPESVREQHFATTGRCDVLLGGPPCQGFSAHRINDAGVNDPRNKLVHRYFDYVRALRPRVFLMENVPGILWQRHREYLNRFYQEGDQAGYDLYAPVVLDARDFGLPQRRKRVFVLGVDKTMDQGQFEWPPKPTHGSELAVRENPELKAWESCEKVFRPIPCDDSNHIHMNHSQALIEVFTKTPINGGSRKDSGRTLPCHAAHNGHKDVYGRIDPSKPAPTMTTACINPSKGRFVHPTENHGITARHAARIQTFPDDFIFSGGLMAAGKQIGNAVPVTMGKILLEHIKQLIDVAPDEQSIEQYADTEAMCA